MVRVSKVFGAGSSHVLTFYWVIRTVNFAPIGKWGNDTPCPHSCQIHPTATSYLHWMSSTLHFWWWLVETTFLSNEFWFQMYVRFEMGIVTSEGRGWVEWTKNEKWVNLFDFDSSEYISIFLLLTMFCLPPTLIRNPYKGVVWGGDMECFCAYLDGRDPWHRKLFGFTESGALCASRVESLRHPPHHRITKWRRSSTDEPWSNKKGRMVETQDIDLIRVVTPKITRCHRCIIFLDWRSVIILTHATLLGWFFELVDFCSCCVGGWVRCFTLWRCHLMFLSCGCG